MNLKQTINESGLGRAISFQKFGDLELVHTAMTGRVPFVANEQAIAHTIEYQRPPIFVARRRTADAAVKFSLDNGHASAP